MKHYSAKRTRRFEIPGRNATPQRVAAWVKDMIGTRPDAFDMGDWVGTKDGVDGLARRVATAAQPITLVPAGQEPPCGTTLCLAGWGALALGFEMIAEKDPIPGNAAYTLARRTEPDGSVTVLEVYDAGTLAFTGALPYGTTTLPVFFESEEEDIVRDWVSLVASGEDPHVAYSRAQHMSERNGSGF